MLGGLVSARIKAAEKALEVGRIDEAFRLATAPDLAHHVRVQKLMAHVAKALFARAEAHFAAERYHEAGADLDRAQQAGGSAPRISDFREIIANASQDRRRQEHERRARVDAAQARIADGSLRAARDILDRDGESDDQTEALRARVEQQAGRAAALYEEAHRYATEGYWAAARERFRDGRRLHPKAPEAVRLEKQLVTHGVDQALKALREGRLDLAIDELSALHGIGDGHTAKRDVTAILDQMRRASRMLASSDYDAARQALLSAQQLLPKAGWIKSACEDLKHVDDRLTRVHAGPLGHVDPATPGKSEQAAGSTDLACSAGRPTTGGLPQRILAWVDGAGSFLILRQDRATIGRAATQVPADIPLVSDLSERHAEIRRVEDDYFMYATREVNVGGEDVRQALLQDNDRIILGNRARLMFKLPSRKTTSAIIDLAGSSRLPNDVRRVILFDRLATISRASRAHIVAPTAAEGLVLFERDGKLWLRHQAAAANETPVEIVMDRPVEMAGVSLVFEEWKTKRDGLYL